MNGIDLQVRGGAITIAGVSIIKYLLRRGETVINVLLLQEPSEHFLMQDPLSGSYATGFSCKVVK